MIDKIGKFISDSAKQTGKALDDAHQSLKRGWVKTKVGANNTLNAIPHVFGKRGDTLDRGLFVSTATGIGAMTFAHPFITLSVLGAVLADGAYQDWSNLPENGNEKEQWESPTGQIVESTRIEKYFIEELSKRLRKVVGNIDSIAEIGKLERKEQRKAFALLSEIQLISQNVTVIEAGPNEASTKKLEVLRATPRSTEESPRPFSPKPG